MPYKTFPITEDKILKVDVGSNRVKLKIVEGKTETDLLKVYFSGQPKRDNDSQEQMENFLGKHVPDQQERIEVWVGKHLK